MRHATITAKNKKQEKRREKEIKNSIFLLISLFATILIITAAISVSIYDSCYNWIEWDRTAVGIITQAITTIIAFVASIIGIVISLQSDKCFDIEVKKFNGLRSGCYFSIKTFIMAGILFVALNVTFYAVNLTIASLVVAILSVFLCLFVAYTEIPIMVKHEKTLMQIIKKWLINHWKNTPKLPEDIKTVLKFLVVKERNIRTTYLILKTKDNDYNKFLIYNLLDVQRDAAKELLLQADDHICDNIMRNIRDILCFHFNLAEAMSGASFYNVHTYLTVTCFQIAKVERYKERVERLLTDELFTIKYLEPNEDTEKFVVSFILGMVLASVAEGNLQFLIAAQEHFSAHHYELAKSGPDTVIFALISMQLFFLCQDSNNASEDLKKKLLDFIDSGGVRNNIKLYSWRKLFNEFSRSFSVDFGRFYKYFCLKEDSFDVKRYWEAQFVILTNEYIMNWYLANLLSSSSLWNFDFRTITDTEAEFAYYFKDIGEKCIDPKVGQFKPTKAMVDIVSFYNPDKKPCAWINPSEREVHRLFGFINTLRKDDLYAQIRKASTLEDVDIVKKYREAIESAVLNEWGYDGKLEVIPSIKTMNLLLQKGNEAINYDEVMIQRIKSSIYRELHDATSITTIPIKDNYDKLFEKVLAIRPVYISWTAACLTCYINDPKLKEKAEQLYATATTFDSEILRGYVFVAQDGFAFNLNIVEFAAQKLTVNQISEIVEDYKRDDGQYVCEGAFVSRDELEEWINKTHITLHISIQYVVSSNKDGIISIEME